MAQRYFNWTLAIVLVVGVVVLAAAALALHKWQRSARAEESLPLGEQAFAIGDWEEAARQIGRYLVINGDDVERLLMYGEAQLRVRPSTRSSVEHAIAAYSSVLRLDSGHAEAAKRLIEIYLGRSPAERPLARSLGEAEFKARQFLESHDDPTVRRLLALALAPQNSQEARRTLTELIADHPDHIPAYEIMGLLAAEHPEDVSKPPNYWFEEAVGRNPQSPLAYILRGAFFRRSGDRPNAMSDFEHAAGMDLSDKAVHLRLIAELTSIGTYDQAREQIEALRAKDPTEMDLWRYWAVVAIQTGSKEEMETVARDGLKELVTYPWDFMPWAAELFIRAEHFDEAAACIQQMQSKDVQPARTAFLQGFLAHQKGQLQEAATFWRNAVALGYQSRQDVTWRGRFPLVRMSLAFVLRQMGDLPSAIEHLRLLASDMPNYPQVNLALAQVLAQVEDWPGVLEQARQVQRLIPGQTEAVVLELQARMRMLAGQDDSPATRNAWQDIETRLAELNDADDQLGQIKLLEAQAALFQGRRAEAAVMLDQLQSDPVSGLSAALLRAQLHAQEGDAPEAVSLLRQTMEKFPQNAEPVRQLALLLNRQGDHEACEKTLRDAWSAMDSPVRRQLGMLLAELYASWGQEDRHYEWLVELTQQFPDDIESRRRLLAIPRVVEDPVRSQAIVDQIKEIEGENGRQWRVEQARIWILSEDFARQYTQIVRLLQENLLASPEDRPSHLLLAAAYEKAGEVQRALTMYREAMQRWPDDVRIITRMIQTLYQAGRDEEAMQMLERIQARDLHDPEIRRLELQGHLRRGASAADSETRRDALDSASEILRELVRQDPNDTQAGLRLVSTLAAQDKYEEAQAVLDVVKARDPESDSVVVAQVQLYSERGDVEAALRLCNETISRRDDLFGRMLRGTTYAAFERYDEARADFDRMVALEPEKVEVWMTRSDFLRRIGRLGEAVSDIEKALQLAPNSLPVQRQALSLFLQSGDPTLVQRGEALLEEVLVSHPGDVDLKLSKARLLLRRETAPAAEQARSLLREITEERPKLAEAWELLCVLELREDQVGRAMDVALQGLAQNPDSRRLLLLKARAEARRSPMLAVPTLRGLFDRDPNDIDVASQLAFAYVRSDRPQEAVQLLRKHLAAQKGPARKQSEITLATVLYQIGDVDEAAAIFTRLAQAEPDDASLALIWARTLASEQRWAEAKAVVADWRARHPNDIAVSSTFARDLVAGRDKQGLQIAEEFLRSDLQSHPQSVGLLHLLANVTSATDRVEEAVALNRKIIEIDPNDVFAVNNLAWLLCEEQGQYARALELANRGLTLRPEYIDLIDTRGVIHYRMGNFEKALEDLTRCVELYPINASALASTHFHLARVYAEMGRRADATRHVQQALTLHRQSEQSTDPGQRKSVLSEGDLDDARRLLDQLQKGVG
ncbi:tetratricopeptide repeat protein [Anaerobaca lacustris]|uniref:Tetratricopeptide repeat protein n=1 Tax=Anaerobaca lacustris TaxID=3044600 RepID=A0AAW6TZK3_9BACT|nr:tetratricopeptide repeat protein [Sedimentisphaerales bacterium M17dextr]